MAATTPTPEKVVEGIKQDIAALDPAKNVPLEKLAKEWGVSKWVVQHIKRRSGVDIQEYRKSIAEGALQLALITQEKLGRKLFNKKAVADTPIRDLALAHEKLVNSAVTAQDGHAPAVSLNFAFIAQQQKNLANYDAIRARESLAERKLQLTGRPA